MTSPSDEGAGVVLPGTDEPDPSTGEKPIDRAKRRAEETQGSLVDIVAAIVEEILGTMVGQHTQMLGAGMAAVSDLRALEPRFTASLAAIEAATARLAAAESALSTAQHDIAMMKEDIQTLKGGKP